MTFELFPWRFQFAARDRIVFPDSLAANVLRGAFGHILCRSAGDAYANLFAPRLEGNGPSGLRDCPRPFVFRAAHLNGSVIPAGQIFHFDLHVFLASHPPLSRLAEVFSQFAVAGIGPGRGRAELSSIWQLDAEGAVSRQVQPESMTPLVLSLEPDGGTVQRLRVRFLTPTELKGGTGETGAPEFAVLFSRARDRVATLRSLYGGGTPPLDFRGMGDRSGQVRTIRWQGNRIQAERRSSRTGQSHPLGGFVGEAEYEGEMAEFLPILAAAEWTGIGRQTVWGKGEIACEPLD